jgi:hypothetical protein
MYSNSGKGLSVIPALVLFILLSLPLKNALVDDTYIHLQYARNLAERGELAFNPGDPVYGSTSPLFVALLAVFHGVGGDILRWCRIVSLIFAVLSIAIIYRFVRTHEGTTTGAAAAAFILAADAWLLRWSAVGMETSLATLTVAAVLVNSFSFTGTARRSLFFGLLLFLAFLARPEAILLAPLSLVAIVSVKNRNRAACYLWLLLFLPLLILWLFVIHAHTGSYLPLTAGAKQGGAAFSSAVFARASTVLKIAGVTHLLPWIAILCGLTIGLLRNRSFIGSFLPLRIREQAENTQGNATHCIHDYRRGIVLLLLWTVTLPLAYTLLDFDILSRYLVPLAPAVVILSIFCVKNLCLRFVRSPLIRGTILTVFCLLVVAQNVTFYSQVVVPSTRDFSRGLQRIMGSFGTWLRENTGDNTVVATPDIGAIGYISQRPILDLGGLITPEINRMRRYMEVHRIIDEGLYLDFHPDFVIDRSEYPDRFAGKALRGYRFEPVMKGRMPNLGISRRRPVTYVLYRLDKMEDE